MSTKKILKRYGLEFVNIRDIDLRTTHPQCTPSRPVNSFFGETGSMVDSPHAEFARLYYDHGLKWMKKNYRKTRLCLLRTKLGKQGFDMGMVKLCDSIKRGYLYGKYSSEHIIVIDVPFCNSRYNLNEDNMRVPEIFSGHHRTGSLLALGKFVVPVIFCSDKFPGSCFSNGKIHSACWNG